MRQIVSAPLRMKAVAALPGHHHAISTNVAASATGVNWPLALILDARPSLAGVIAWFVNDNMNDIVDRPLLGPLVNPDAIGEIGSSDAHGGLMSWYTVDI